MGSRYEVEVTVASARDLKNVNWRNGDLKPYAVLWVDSGAKVSTRVDLDNGECPSWDEKVLVPLPPSSGLQDAVLYMDIVHANAAEGVKPLVGSARLPLRDVIDDAGLGGKASRNLRLKRPSGRPHGSLDVRIAVKEPSRYYNSDAAAYPAPAGGYGSSGHSYPYGAGAPPARYSAYGAAPPAGYPAYNPAPPAYAQGYGASPPNQAGYGSGQPAYDYHAAGTTTYAEPTKKKEMGMGTGLAVGAGVGLLGGLALVGGASYVEDKIDEHIEEQVDEQLEERLEEDHNDGGGGYDDYGGDDE